MSKRILIIDDEPDVLVYLAAVLESDGYSVRAADNAVRGLQLAGEFHPDLICLDIMMPEESGLSLYLKLRASDELCHIPVIIVSGIINDQELDFHRVLEEKNAPPPEQYIEKPIEVEQFLTVIRRHANKAGASQKKRESNK